jgi:UDP-glucose 4-epimerase
MGVVYYANYFVWFEVARADLLRTGGWSYREMEHSGVSLPVIEAHCEYRKPAKYDDELEVVTEGRLLSPVRMEFTYESAAADGAVAAEAHRACGARRARTAVQASGSGSRGVRVKALVTGTAGFIGSHLTAALLDRGTAVVGIDCFTDYYARALKEANLAVNAGRPEFEFVESSIQMADLGALLDGVTHVFHLAAQAGVRKSWGRDFRTYTEHNVDASQRLLEACVGRPIQKFVYASSSSLYGDAVTIPVAEDALPRPLSPYGVTKLAAEHLCQLYWANHRVPTTSVRYFTVYGPRQRPDMAFHRFITAALTDQPITIYGDGARRATSRSWRTPLPPRSPPAIGRAGSGNVGGGSRVSVQHVLDILERLSGHPLKIAREGAQKGDVRDTFADTSLARRDLGFAPKVSLEQGLEAEYRWLSTLPAHA